mgnify:CR=1 FL=1
MAMRQAILIADDIEMNRAILRTFFEDTYEILEAANGAEALHQIHEGRDSLAAVLLDIVMPEMDGFQVLEALQGDELLQRVPIFLITAENSQMAIRRGYALGAVDFIVKPFMPEMIRQRMANVIELYRNRQRLRGIVDEQIQELEKQARQLEKQAQELRETNSAIIETLATVIEFRDCESGEHVKRIRSLTMELLRQMEKRLPQVQFDEEQLQLICDASVMHDVGKVAIPDYILQKPGRLTPEERAIMQEHTIRGCEILNTIPRLRSSEIYPYCWDICRHHHERWDGKGYPDGLKGDEISIWAQVVSLADVYDALVSKRVYKKAMEHEKAVELILSGGCGAFNPQLLDCFVEIADSLYHKFYLDSPVEQLRYERRNLKGEETNG